VRPLRVRVVLVRRRRARVLLRPALRVLLVLLLQPYVLVGATKEKGPALCCRQRSRPFVFFGVSNC
jgi:hypothetical protein